MHQKRLQFPFWLLTTPFGRALCNICTSFPLAATTLQVHLTDIQFAFNLKHLAALALLSFRRTHTLICTAWCLWKAIWFLLLLSWFFCLRNCTPNRNHLFILPPPCIFGHLTIEYNYCGTEVTPVFSRSVTVTSKLGAWRILTVELGFTPWMNERYNCIFNRLCIWPLRIEFMKRGRCSWEDKMRRHN